MDSLAQINHHEYPTNQWHPSLLSLTLIWLILKIHFLNIDCYRNIDRIITS